MLLSKAILSFAGLGNGDVLAAVIRNVRMLEDLPLAGFTGDLGSWLHTATPDLSLVNLGGGICSPPAIMVTDPSSTDYGLLWGRGCSIL